MHKHGMHLNEKGNTERSERSEANLLSHNFLFFLWSTIKVRCNREVDQEKKKIVRERQSSFFFYFWLRTASNKRQSKEIKMRSKSKRKRNKNFVRLTHYFLFVGPDQYQRIIERLRNLLGLALNKKKNNACRKKVVGLKHEWLRSSGWNPVLRTQQPTNSGASTFSFSLLFCVADDRAVARSAGPPTK